MTAWKPTISLVALAICLVAVAGCGGDDEGKPIPAATASGLQTELNGVQARLNQGSAGACRDILGGPRGPNKQRVQGLIDAMPDDVDTDIRSALQDSFDNLWDLVQQDCDDKAAKEDSGQEEQQPAEPEPTPTESTPTETTPTETTPTETTPTETTPPSEEQLPPEGNGNNNGSVPGNGNGDGNGKGGGAVSPGGADLGGGE